jgi:hypothetical protein
MTTKLKSETARTNGATSSGPATLEGKARASQNSLKHGLSSKQILLPAESADDFETLRAAHFGQFCPATPLEAELVETLAATRWRLRRLAAIEANILQNEIDHPQTHLGSNPKPTARDARTAWSFRNVADTSSSLHMIIRYEATLSRTYNQAFRQLQLLQKQRAEQVDAKPQNEPTAVRSAPIPSPLRATHSGPTSEIPQTSPTVGVSPTTPLSYDR